MKKIIITENWVPLVLLGICVMSFGILIPQLGYYWDDWMHLYLTNTYKDPGALVYQAFRPLHAWLDVAILSIIGTNPIYWHILSLLFRWLAAWGLWEVLRRIWLEHSEQTAWIAILFSIYPTFFQQSAAVIFYPHWLSLFLFFISLVCMLLAIKNKKWYWPLTILGVLTTIAHLYNLEILAGLELTRPIVLWIFVSKEIEGRRARITQVLKHWAPYFMVLVVFTLWRFFYVQIENDPSQPLSFSELIRTPSALIDLVIFSLRDLLHMFLTSWYKILQPELISIEYPSDLLAWGLAFITFVVLYFMMRVAKFRDSDVEDRWSHHAMVFGLFATIVALLPVWFTGRKVTVGLWSDRLSIPAMIGASIFFVAAISMIIPRRKTRQVLFCVLVALAVATHFRTGNNFRWEWIRQKRTYWQLYWRAPAIEPHTPIITDGALTSFVSRYAATFAINMLYPQNQMSELPTYWYFEVQYNKLDDHIPELLEGVNLRDDFYSVSFKGKSKDSILIYTTSGEDRCVWFLTPEDVDNEELPLEMRQLAEIVNLDRILPVSFNDDYPIEDIFGPEPEHTWCYFYQKASLAHQLGDWEQVVELWEEANKLGYQTENVYEFLPFIEASAVLGQWDQAVTITQKADNLTKKTDALLCVTWERFNRNNKGRDDYDLAYEEVMNTLGCP
jgi:hypothetical protein